jgi:hypothetical protein
MWYFNPAASITPPPCNYYKNLSLPGCPSGMWLYINASKCINAQLASCSTNVRGVIDCGSFYQPLVGYLLMHSFKSSFDCCTACFYPSSSVFLLSERRLHLHFRFPCETNRLMVCTLQRSWPGSRTDSICFCLVELHGRMLHITDMHPDPHYVPHTSKKKACHRKKRSNGSGYYGTPHA